MSSQNQSIMFLCGVCCIYPGVAAALAVFVYRRWTMGGWRGVIGGRDDKSL